MPERKLAVEVINNVVNSLDAYIRIKRKSYASNQRIYLEKRITLVKDSLAKFEENLRDFRARNSIVMQSPDLIMRQDRLIRDVQILNSVFIELTKQLELAKLDEIRDTPILNIKEYAKDPIEKSGPNRKLIFLLILLSSIFLSGIYFSFKDDGMKTLRRLCDIGKLLVGKR